MGYSCQRQSQKLDDICTIMYPYWDIVINPCAHDVFISIIYGWPYTTCYVLILAHMVKYGQTTSFYTLATQWARSPPPGHARDSLYLLTNCLLENTSCNYMWKIELKTITSLRMIPTMTFIHFLTGKSSGILSDISSGILFGISSGISSGILSGKSSGILSGISSGILSGISSDILSDISSDILSGILSGISSDILSDIFSSRWGPAVPTAIWKSRLRSGSAHCDLEVAVEAPAVPTGIWSSRWRSGSAHWDLELAVEVQQCPLRSARRRTRRRMRRRRRRRTALIKSNNPHLAGGELRMFLFNRQVLLNKLSNWKFDTSRTDPHLHWPHLQKIQSKNLPPKHHPPRWHTSFRAFANLGRSWLPMDSREVYCSHGDIIEYGFAKSILANSTIAGTRHYTKIIHNCHFETLKYLRVRWGSPRAYLGEIYLWEFLHSDCPNRITIYIYIYIPYPYPII